MVALTERDTKEGEVYEISSMEEIEKELLRNWVPERKCRNRLEELVKNNLFLTKDGFLKSPAEAPAHRKVLLEDKDITKKTASDFTKLCENTMTSSPRTAET